MEKKDENLVSILVEQHTNLKKTLTEIQGILSASKSIDCSRISTLLQKFGRDLEEHLTLENDTFYVQLLKMMKEKKYDISKTESFISEMKKIEKEVIAFLSTYEHTQDVEEKIEEFKKEFPAIVNTLSVRIESEEAGVYSYWVLF